MRNLIPKKETYPHSTNTHCRAIVYSYFVLVFLSLVIWRIKKFTWLPKYVTGRYIMLEVNLTHRWKYVLLSVTIWNESLNEHRIWLDSICPSESTNLWSVIYIFEGSFCCISLFSVRHTKIKSFQCAYL